MQDTILIVDDERDLLSGLKRTLAMEMDCRILVAENAETALRIVADQDIDLILADIRMPGMDGITLLENVKTTDPNVTVIIMTAYGTIEKAVEAIKVGAYDFIQKPFDEKRLVHLLKNGLERNRLVRENKRLLQKIENYAPFEKMVGQSKPMQQVFERIEMLAKTDVTVLILGETGTGKELAADALHAKSNRGQYPLITVNCPALPENILESELFGYKKGAFTNADEDKAGLFVKAHGSTIFLDEIGDLSTSVQTKLLRFLQDKTIKPLGANTSRKVDARIIAATNQDLKHKMEVHKFRNDLYYRLNVASVVMPPLREIPEDIPLLVEHFVKKIAREQKSEPKQVTPEVMAYLINRQWPGNIRELENTIRGWYAVISGEVIDTPQVLKENPCSDENAALQNGALQRPYKDLKADAIESFTRKYLYRLLEHTQGNITLSAQLSGIKRQSLQKIIKRYRISVAPYRKSAR